jgi:hypothetical protein
MRFGLRTGMGNGEPLKLPARAGFGKVVAPALLYSQVLLIRVPLFVAAMGIGNLFPTISSDLERVARGRFFLDDRFHRIIQRGQVFVDRRDAGNGERPLTAQRCAERFAALGTFPRSQYRIVPSRG